MKRCPDCRRDYHDDTLLYCLDDGTALLEGPGATGGPVTAILHDTAAPREASTRAQIHTPEAEPPESFYDSTERQSLPAHQTAEPQEHQTAEAKQHRVAKPTVMLAGLALLLVVGGFLGYRYFASTNQIESIAVMPFVNEGGNPDVEYLSDGITETLIKSLSNVPDLDVKPRSAVFRYKGKDADLQTIGRELNVQAILNGRVVQRGDQLSLSLELVDVQKNRVIWTEAYQRAQSELVSLQSEIARDVSTRLTPKLSGLEETKVTKAAAADPAAYQAYLRGRYYWNRRTTENLKKAIEQFKIATDRDPNYALAFAGLSDCYAVMTEYTGTPSSETLPQARTYAERALSIDDQLAESHATLALIHRQSWNWAEAERAFNKAIEINSKYATAYHWYSIFLKDMGRDTEAATAIQRAHELDPLSSVIAVNVAEMYQLQGSHAAAIEACFKVLELDPTYAGAYEDLAISYAKTGRHAEALAAGEKAVELTKRAGITLGTFGFVNAAAGRKAEAVSIIQELEDKYSQKAALGIDIAFVYAELREKDKAFEWLEKDFQVRNGKLGMLRWRGSFDTLRDDPRFKDLVKRMGLPE